MKSIVLLKRGDAGEVAQKSIEDYINRDAYNPPQERLIVYTCDTDINKVDLKCDLLISMNYDKRVVNQVNKIPCYNIHLSPLPRYAGYNQFYWAIMNEEKEWAITMHKMELEFDTGDIVQQLKFPISLGETARSLFDKSLSYIPSLIKGNLDKILYDEIELEKQDLTKRTFNKKNSVDYSQTLFLNDKDFYKKVRALYFPPNKLPDIKSK